MAKWQQEWPFDGKMAVEMAKWEWEQLLMAKWQQEWPFDGKTAVGTFDGMEHLSGDLPPVLPYASQPMHSTFCLPIHHHMTTLRYCLHLWHYHWLLLFRSVTFRITDLTPSPSPPETLCRRIVGHQTLPVIRSLFPSGQFPSRSESSGTLP